MVDDSHIVFQHSNTEKMQRIAHQHNPDFAESAKSILSACDILIACVLLTIVLIHLMIFHMKIMILNA